MEGRDLDEVRGAGEAWRGGGDIDLRELIEPEVSLIGEEGVEDGKGVEDCDVRCEGLVEGCWVLENELSKASASLVWPPNASSNEIP